MQQRVSFITLGVSDLARSRSFYESGLGWKLSSRGSSAGVAFFQLSGGPVLALYSRDALAQEMGLPPSAPSGFAGIALAYNVHERSEVAEILLFAQAAGASILKPAEDTFWGGHSGYFADPDGYPWEVAWNPHFTLTVEGQMQLPE